MPKQTLSPVSGLRKKYSENGLFVGLVDQNGSDLFAGMVPGSNRLRGYIHTHKLPGSSKVNNIAGNFTTAGYITAEGHFDAVRLCYGTATGAIMGGILAKVAPTASANDYLNPVNSAGTPDNALWADVTFPRVTTNRTRPLESAKAITGATQASPGVFTATGHGYVSGRPVYLNDLGGMVEANDKFYRVVVIDANTFSLQDMNGTAINTTGYTAYTSGGYVAAVALDVGRDFNLPPSNDLLTTSGQLMPGVGTKGGSAMVESHAFSEWVYVSSLDRIDGASLPALMIGSYTASGSSVTHAINAGTTPSADWFGADKAATHLGREWRGRVQAGNKLGNHNGSWSNEGLFPCHAIQLLSRNRGLAVAHLADSLGDGVGSQGLTGSGNSGGMNSYGRRACALISSMNFPVTHANWGLSGSNSLIARARLPMILANYSPDVLVIKVWSPNDGSNTYGIGYVRTALALAALYGVTVVVETAPAAGSTGATETARQSANAWARERAAEGEFFLADQALALGTTPGTSNEIPPALLSSGAHPNDAGYALMAACLAEVLAKIR